MKMRDTAHTTTVCTLRLHSWTREAAVEAQCRPDLARLPLAVEKRSEDAVAATMTTIERQQPALPLGATPFSVLAD